MTYPVTCVCVRVHVCVCMHVHVNVNVHVFVRAYMCSYVHACVRDQIYKG